MAQVKPIIAVVGRPNVGKSTFFNKMVGARVSIVEDTPGVTRDRVYADSSWQNYEFTLVDTGGIDPYSDDPLLQQMRRQAEIAVDTADVILFFVDGKDGLTGPDYEVADLLRRTKKPVLLVVNKIDTPLRENDKAEFYALGMGEPHAISSVNLLGIGDLLEEMCKYLPDPDPDAGQEEGGPIKIAVVGRPNVGKSSLVNRILKEDRVMVSDIAGTTRDAIDTAFTDEGDDFVIIDTAGIRETHDAIESIGIERTFQKLDQADIVLWMIDAADASLQIAQLSEKILPRSEGKQLILVFNKADLLTDRQFKPTDLPENVQSIFISAKKREHIDKLQDLLIQAAHIPSLSSNDVIVTNIRHYEALTHALESIHRVQEGLSANLSGDFISQDLRECIFHLSDIVGEVTTDQVLGNIFERFCIGK
mgnify:CR=1 FL=1